MSNKILRWLVAAGLVLVVAGLTGVVIGAAVLAVPLDQWRRAGDPPPIHDISTDLDDPPRFVALRDPGKPQAWWPPPAA